MKYLLLTTTLISLLLLNIFVKEVKTDKNRSLLTKEEQMEVQNMIKMLNEKRSATDTYNYYYFQSPRAQIKIIGFNPKMDSIGGFESLICGDEEGGGDQECDTSQVKKIDIRYGKVGNYTLVTFVQFPCVQVFLSDFNSKHLKTTNFDIPSNISTTMEEKIYAIDDFTKKECAEVQTSI